MKRKLKAYLFLSLLLSYPSLHAQLTDSVMQHIEETLRPVTSPEAPGCSAAIVKDGKILYQSANGLADVSSGRVVGIHDLYQVDAIAKQFTSLAFLQLLQVYKIKATEDISTFLPQLKDYNYPIQIRHVLHHTTGLDDYKLVAQVRGDGYNNRYLHLNNEDALGLISLQERLSHKPGSEFSIFDADTESVLMAAIIEEVSDTSFSAFVKEHVFEVLGLEDARFIDDPSYLYDAKANSYRVDDEVYHSITDVNEIVGPGNLFISIADMAKWYQYFSPKCTKPGHELVKQLDDVCLNDLGETYQSSWGEMTIGRSYFHYESGAPLYWQFGVRSGYGANVFRYFSKDVTSIVLGNNNQYNGYYAMTLVEPLVRDAYTRNRSVTLDDIISVDMPTSQKVRWEGVYHDFSSGFSREITFEKDTLRYVRGSRSINLIPIGEGEFQAEMQSDDILIFRFNEEQGRKFYEVVTGDSDPVVYNMIDENFLPNEEDIASCAGVYIHEGLGELIKIYQDEEGLQIRHSAIGSHALRSIKKDVYASDVYVMSGVEFQRRDGVVVALRFRAPGMQSMYFKKVAPVSSAFNKI